jgi:hypothetical protein
MGPLTQSSEGIDHLQHARVLGVIQVIARQKFMSWLLRGVGLKEVGSRGLGLGIPHCVSGDGGSPLERTCCNTPAQETVFRRPRNTLIEFVKE